MRAGPVIRRLPLIGALVVTPLLAAAFVRGGAPRSPAPSLGPVEGVFEYLPPTRGYAIATGGHYIYFFGPADGSAPMTANAGTYTVSGDTITNTVRYAMNPAAVGTSFRWVSSALAGDTAEFRVVNAAGRVTSSGRSVRLR